MRVSLEDYASFALLCAELTIFPAFAFSLLLTERLCKTLKGPMYFECSCFRSSAADQPFSSNSCSQRPTLRFRYC